MIPGCFDWPEQYAGDTAPWQKFTLREKGEPISLVDAVIVMQVRKHPKKAPILENTSVASAGIEILDAAGGVFRVGGYENPDVNDVYVYDIQITFPSGEVKTPLRGQYPIVGQVTKQEAP